MTERPGAVRASEPARWTADLPWLALLYAVAYAVRWWITEDRISAGHGDVSAYFQVARNLFLGRGFVQDFVADRLMDPTGLPTPSNTHWLPLPSIIAFLGMKLAGEPSYTAGKLAMIAVSAAFPLIGYAAGRILIGTRAGALATGVLSLGFHLYLDQPCAILSHGPYGVFCGGALLVVLGLARGDRWLPAFGVLLGLTYLVRGDSQVLLVGLALALLYRRLRRVDPLPIPWRKLALAAALFAAVAAPWWVRNVRVFGEMMPSGVSRVMWAREYEQWFSDPADLTRENFLAWKYENIRDQKLAGIEDALSYAPLALHRSIIREREPLPQEVRIAWLGQYVLTPLLWLGLLVLAVRRPLAVGLVLLHVLLLVFVYGVVFPAIGRESFRSSMFSVYPVYLAAIVAAIDLALWPLRRFVRGGARGADASLIAAALVLAYANVAAIEPHLAVKYRDIESAMAPYREFGTWARGAGLEDQVFFCRNPWQFSTETGLKAVMLPYDTPERILAVAKQFGVRYFYDDLGRLGDLDRVRPGAALLIRRGDLFRLEVATPQPLYRLRQ